VPDDKRGERELGESKAAESAEKRGIRLGSGKSACGSGKAPVEAGKRLGIGKSAWEAGRAPGKREERLGSGKTPVQQLGSEKSVKGSAERGLGSKRLLRVVDLPNQCFEGPFVHGMAWHFPDYGSRSAVSRVLREAL